MQETEKSDVFEQERERMQEAGGYKSMVDTCEGMISAIYRDTVW
jgi:hypothetical protein